MDRLVRALISHVTNFDDGSDDNFDLCYDYVASNLLYHNCVEPREKQVNTALGGIVEKLLIHSETERAAALKSALAGYNASFAANNLERDHAQYDIRIRLLAFLANLSNSGSEGSAANWKEDIARRREELEEEDSSRPEREDWAAILGEGERRWAGPGSREDSLSDWSDDDAEDELGRLQDHSQDEESDNNAARSLRPPRPFAVTDDGWRRDKKDCCNKVDVESAESRLQALMQPRGSSCRPSAAGHSERWTENAHFVAVADSARARQGAPVSVKTKFTEYQLVRECLWMLRQPPNDSTAAFDYDPGRGYSLRADACLASASPDALSRSLEYLTVFLHQVKDLRDFTAAVLRSDEVCYTYEAYAGGLDDVLHLMSADLVLIEERVTGQQETFTLLDLEASLRSWAITVAAVHACHARSAVAPGDKDFLVWPNWRKAVRLISGVFLSMHICHETFAHEIILDLYLKSCAPYLRIIGLWLTEGRLEDFRDEFVFKQRPSAAASGDEEDAEEETEDFWKSGFEVRPYLETLSDDGDLRLPSMLGRALPKILVAGKSIEILARLAKRRRFSVTLQTGNDSGAVFRTREDLLSQFLSNLRRELKMPTECEELSPPRRNKEKPKSTICLDSLGVDFGEDGEDVDPYLKMAFEEVFKAAEVDLADSDSPLRIEGSSSDRSSFVLPAPVDPILPLSSALERSFIPPVFEHYRFSCQSLVRTVMGTLELNRHLGAVRRVFLMEAGDIMADFCTDVFARIGEVEDGEAAKEEDRENDGLDTASVTLLLQDSVGRRYPSDADRFSVAVAAPSSADSGDQDWLDRVTLSYSVEWPLNIVLDSASFAMYNQVFLFLMRVKRSVWTLHQIEARELAQRLAEGEALRRRMAEERNDNSEDGELQDDEDEGLTADGLIHRVLLLRSWLFHFVGNVHSYFMTRVLHSTEIELTSELKSAGDLDEIIRAHASYISRIHDRCFLHPSVRILREAVAKVNNIDHVLLISPIQFLFLQVLDVCRRLAAFCAMFGGPEKPEEKALVAMEETYVRSHQFLASTLESMTAMRNVPHLDSLAAALVYSCPEKW